MNLLNDNSQENQSVWIGIKKALKGINSPLYAIRSSTTKEDLPNFSGAGLETSELRIAEDDIRHIIEGMVHNLSDTEGSIIIQEMILGDFSGVILTCDPINRKNNKLIIEVVPGGNEILTSGKVLPVRYIYNRDDKSIKEQSGGSWNGLLKSDTILMLVELAERIERLFGKPQDIEWTLVGNEVYVLQSRNIVENTVTGVNSTTKKRVSNRDTLSIYRAYALPRHLQNHMLRVASVALWIVRNWTGSKLNENTIIKTLLIHDMGNVVRADNEIFRHEDEYKISAQYWKNAFEWIARRYGKTDIDATLNIAKEIGVEETVLELIKGNKFINNNIISKSKDYAIKICAYADQRVSPSGILSLRERLQEAINRNKKTYEANSLYSDSENLIECAYEIEKQIFEYVKGNPEDINDDIINPYMQELKKYSFL